MCGSQLDVLRQTLQLSAKYCEWCTQLVRCVGYEALGCLYRILETADHIVERYRQTLQLIPGLHHGQPLAQAELGNFLCLVCDGVYRLQCALDEDGPADDGYGDGDRQTETQDQEHLPQDQLGPQCRNPDFDNVARTSAAPVAAQTACSACGTAGCRATRYGLGIGDRADQH